MRKFWIALIAGSLLLSACSKAGSPHAKDAIREAIEAHLRANPQLLLEKFNTEIERVTYKGDTAEAMAKFVSKSEPSSAVEVRYQLKREAGKWKVVSSQSVGGMGMGAHGGAAGSMPMGHPPVTGNQGTTSPAPEASH